MFFTYKLMKRCVSCGNYKPLGPSCFSRHSGRPDGYREYCKQCDAVHRKKYYNKNRDKIIQKSKDYRKMHIDDCKRKQKEYYNKPTTKEKRKLYRENNKERLRKQRRNYYLTHKEETREDTKRWRLKNPDKSKESALRSRERNKEKIKITKQNYWKNHKENRRINERRRNSLKKNLPFDFTAEDEKFALEYWQNRCAVCGKELDTTKGNKSWAMDHWIPLSDPRPDNPGTVPTNMLPLCHGIGGCNNKKQNYDPPIWLYSCFTKEEADELMNKIVEFFNVVRKT